MGPGSAPQHFVLRSIRDKRLEHDPEKCEAVFRRDKLKSVCAEIMLNQRI
jgi:hypothetical protein